MTKINDIRTYSNGTEVTSADAAERRDKLDYMARAQQIGNWGSIHTDLASGVAHWSDQVYRILGLPVGDGEASFARFLASVHPDDVGTVRAGHARTLASYSPDSNEYRIVRPDGAIRWISRVAEAIRDENGQPLTLVTTIHDITERRAMEDELRRSREHLARVQKVGRIGSTEVDLKTQQVYWSDEIYQLLGFAPGSVAPGVDSFADAVHPDDRPLMRDVSLKGRRGEETEPCECRIVGPDGTVRWFYRQAEFARDERGAPVTLITTMYEVTERRAIEEALRRSQRHLLRAQHIGRIGSSEYSYKTGDYRWS